MLRYYYATPALDTVVPRASLIPKTSPGTNTVFNHFFHVPDHVSMTLYADHLTEPRVLAFDAMGHTIVSSPKTGQIIALVDADHDGFAEQHVVLLDHLHQPHGVTFYTKNNKEYLYVAETEQVTRYLYDSQTLKVIGPAEFIAKLPADGKHITRTLMFGPKLRTQSLGSNLGINDTNEDRLYVSVGSSCDACEEDIFKRAAILESDAEGTYLAQFARGLRNSIFFTFHPKTHQMWATEMGRDGLGDTLPPDEINIIEFNKDYGWPQCYGNQVKDVTYTPTDAKQACSDTVPAAIDLPAHVAPMGLAFIPSGQLSAWPQDRQDNLLVAYHGSTNASKKVGYKIVRFVLDDKGRVVRAEDFISGWLQGSKVLGRPVDLKMLSDGTLLVTDDYAGVVYKITYTP